MTSLQAALDAIETAVGPMPDEQTGLIAAKCWGLMHGYNARWQNQTWRAVQSETEFKVPIYNLAAKRQSVSKTLQLAGKLDKRVVDEQGTQFVLDHKTTLDDLAPDSTYWRQLVVEGQASLYILVEHLYGVRVAGAVWDVIRKPGIRPRKLTKADKAAIVSLPNKYFGFTVSAATVGNVQAGMESEDLELYGYRLAAETLQEPNRYFARQSVPRLDSELLEFSHEVWDIAQDILHTRRTGRHYRNSAACMAYGRPCEYLGICSGYDTSESAHWKRRETVHDELSLEDDGRNLLTHSRMRCFQTCKQKHYFRYEVGIERVNERPAEALYFGTLFHKALDAWWSFYYKTERTNNGDSERTTGGPACYPEGENPF